MKTIKKIMTTVLGLVLAMQLSYAQNYKAPKIDASGRVTNEKGTFIGTVTTDGIISDASGVKIAHVDSNGNLIDEKTGKKLGKAEKNGNFLPGFSKTPDKGMSVSAPENGTCQVKDHKGKVKAEVHENYKQFGACAIHCLQHQMNHPAN